MIIGLILALLLLGPLYYPSAGMLVFTSPLSSSLPLWLIVSICASLLLLMIITLKVPIEYGSILILFALLFPGGSVTLLLLLIGLYEKQRSLIRLFGVLLLGYLSLYYYALAPSLLLKSWQLMAAGMLLLIGRQYFIFLDTKRNRCEN